MSVIEILCRNCNGETPHDLQDDCLKRCRMCLAWSTHDHDNATAQDYEDSPQTTKGGSRGGSEGRNRGGTEGGSQGGILADDPAWIPPLVPPRLPPMAERPTPRAQHR